MIMISVLVSRLSQKLISVRVFALYVCTMPTQTLFEKWLILILKITKSYIDGQFKELERLS